MSMKGAHEYMSVDLRQVSAAELLDTWEAGQTLQPIQRALALLMLALPNRSSQALAELSIGQRDAHLLVLREQLFGPGIVAVAICPACAESLELAFDTASIRGVEQPEYAAQGAFDLQTGGYTMRVRPPNSLDLMRVVSLLDGVQVEQAEQKERALLASCLIEVRHGDSVILFDELPEVAVQAIAQHMAEADAQAEIQVAMHCPNCGHAWQALFDVAAFLWREIDAWAQRTLGEVHALASAYGWYETDILAMSASRRQHYLRMIGQEQ
jgi:hypothetical protein